MKKIRFKDVAERMIKARGWTGAIEDLSESDKQNFSTRVNDRLKMAVEGDWWPEFMAVQQRYWRTAYSASKAYIVDDEVYYSSHYYRCIQNGTNKQPDTETAYWELCDEDMVFSIDFEQEGEDEIGSVDNANCLFDEDPLKNVNAVPLSNVTIVGDKIVLIDNTAPTAPWVKYRVPYPQFTYIAWDSTKAYRIGDVVYVATSDGTDVGDCYRAITANTNKDPYTQTDDWVLVEFPEMFLTYVLHGVRADELMEDEGRWKEDAKAEMALDNLRDRMVEQRIGRKVMRTRR